MGPSREVEDSLSPTGGRAWRVVVTGEENIE